MVIYFQGKFTSALEDANKGNLKILKRLFAKTLPIFCSALQMTGGTNQQALRHKAKAMFKMGNSKEAYEMLVQFSQNQTMVGDR